MMSQSLALVAPWLLMLSLGAAQEKDKKDGAKTDEPIRLTVLVIRATTRNNDISPELKSIADELKKAFKFTGFKLESKKAARTNVGETFTTTLTGDYSAEIEPKNRAGKRVTLKVKVTRLENKKQVQNLNTTITIDAGKAQLLGGMKLDQGDDLIVAVSAE